eukprot:TRINITY_DN3188_c0_g1_i1.p1 TRINITY_DN3188_c0_g1~~TRINITY_DN3188_c0_g1_i1.p1  ORF type:complete len:248 (-),score=98.17 TRINITY_DN3188_c0_g1_i1:23-766(-)
MDEVEFQNDASSLVAAMMKARGKEAPQDNEENVELEKRPSRLGLGAKFVPHNNALNINQQKLKKMIKKKPKRDESSDDESSESNDSESEDEDSKTKSIGGKHSRTKMDPVARFLEARKQKKANAKKVKEQLKKQEEAKKIKDEAEKVAVAIEASNKEEIGSKVEQTSETQKIISAEATPSIQSVVANGEEDENKPEKRVRYRQLYDANGNPTRKRKRTKTRSKQKNKRRRPWGKKEKMEEAKKTASE